MIGTKEGVSSSKPVNVALVQSYLEQPPTPSDLQAVVAQQANTFQEAVGKGVDIVEQPQKKVTGLMKERKRSAEAAFPLRDLSMKEMVGGGAGQQPAARQPDRDQQRRRNFDERGERSGGFERERNYEGGSSSRGGQRREDREDEGGHRGWQGGRADRGEGNREASGWERDSLQQPFDLEAEKKR